MCPVMIITIYFEADHKKLVSSQKSSIFGPQKGHFGQSGPWNGPPSGQTTTYQKTKGIQSSLRIWRSCHPIKMGPSEPKKWWFHRCSVKNAVLQNNNRFDLYTVFSSNGFNCTKLTFCKQIEDFIYNFCYIWLCFWISIPRNVRPFCSRFGA